MPCSRRSSQPGLNQGLLHCRWILYQSVIREALPLLGITPKELSAGTVTDICTSTFIAALFTTVKRQKQPKSPSTDEWTKCLTGTEFQLCKMERVLWLDDSDGYPKTWMYLMPMNCMLCVVYHNFQKLLKKSDQTLHVSWRYCQWDWLKDWMGMWDRAGQGWLPGLGPKQPAWCQCHFLRWVRHV